MDITFDRLQSSVSHFFAWWLGEIQSFLPLALRQRFLSQSSQYIVTVEKGQASFFEETSGDLNPLGKIKLSRDSESQDLERDEIRDLLERREIEEERFHVRLPKDKVLRREIELPLQADENLREVVSFEMDRHTPFKSDEVYFDFLSRKRDLRNKRLRIDLVVVPKALADPLLDRVRGWGLIPAGLGIDGVGSSVEEGFELAPALAADDSGHRRLWLRLGVAAVSFALLIGLLNLPLYFKRQELEIQETRLENIRVEATKASKIKAEVEAILNSSRALVARKLDNPAAIALLNEVTRLLPDDTWVIKFSWRGDDLLISGYSQKPSALIALLEQSELLEEVHFSSPVTLDQRIGMERFNLAALVKGGQGQ
jgi:general secretion pathway protein L